MRSAPAEGAADPGQAPVPSPAPEATPGGSGASAWTPAPAWTRIEIATVGLLAGLVLLLLGAAANRPGLPVDEPYYFFAADQYVDWILGRPGGTPPRPRLERDAAFTYLHEHPPVGTVAAGLSGRWLGGLVGRPAAYRMSPIILLVLLAVGLYAAGRRAWGRPAGAAAALALLTSPRMIGHGMTAALDLPSAAVVYAAAMAFVLGCRGGLWPLVSGSLLGLACATKHNALLLPPALALWAWLYRRRDSGPALAAMLLVAPVVFILVWPWLWTEPAGRILDWLLFHVRHYPLPTWYFGTLYKDPPAPWHYPFVLTAITLPLPILLLALVGALRVVAGRLRDRIGALALLNALLPLLAVARPGQPRYDGERTFLSAFPFLFLLAGLGAAWLLGRLASRTARPGWLAGVALALLFGPLALQALGEHPHQRDFYGALVGGRTGALRSGFETTNWGGHVANLDVVDWVNRTLPPGATIDTNSGAYGSLAYYQRAGRLRGDLRFEAGGRYWFLECAQAYSAMPGWWDLYADRHPRYRRIASFERDGVPLLNVFELRP